MLIMSIFAYLNRTTSVCGNDFLFPVGFPIDFACGKLTGNIGRATAINFMYKIGLNIMEISIPQKLKILNFLYIL